MTTRGQVNASLDQVSGMVTFHANRNQFNDKSTISLIDTEIQKIIKIAERVHHLDAEVSTSKGYISAVMEAKTNDNEDADLQEAIRLSQETAPISSSSS